ncbi:hypothetical protein N7539_008797 [Penicillium diatomitis]|uniref:Uncharacterized protein n=1 Tax=Penicillium diatomitis TaxID=2819901 RepID=A0A9W9WQR6_9EURO|nr:uncharacterized protein N7539_008797 [Penicillium diatomitis]KAJ5471854.1 hypothetical protein N7539_008797 [Penicillium diatomitis]
MTGAKRCSIQAPRKAPDADAIREQLRPQRGGFDPTSDNIRAWLKQNIDEPNKEFEWFEGKYQIATHLIYYTVNKIARGFIADSSNSYD